jgi:hypothetical protein
MFWKFNKTLFYGLPEAPQKQFSMICCLCLIIKWVHSCAVADQINDFAIAAARYFSFCELRPSGNPRKQRFSLLSCESRWTFVLFMGVFNSVLPLNTKSQCGVLRLRWSLHFSCPRGVITYSSSGSRGDVCGQLCPVNYKRL